MKNKEWVDFFLVLLRAAERLELKEIKKLQGTPIDSETRVIEAVCKQFVQKFRTVEGELAGNKLETILRIVNHRKVNINACVESLKK